MTGSTYATGKPLPPRDQWVPRVFHRLSDDGKPMFYVIDLPADDDVSTHAELNPGTLKIEDGFDRRSSLEPAMTELPETIAKARRYAAIDIIEGMAKAIARDRGREWYRMTSARKAQCRSQARAALRTLAAADPAIIAATAYVTEPPTLADFQIAAGAAALLPKTSHPDGPDVLADLARDWRLQIEGILK